MFEIECPAHMAYGHASPFDLENGHIPVDSPLRYEIELIDCTKIDHKTLRKRAMKKAKKESRK